MSKVEEAERAMVVPSKGSAKVDLCEIEKVTLRDPGTGEVQPVSTFEYQKRRYLWEAGTGFRV